jgi:hypothetical protein
VTGAVAVALIVAPDGFDAQVLFKDGRTTAIKAAISQRQLFRAKFFAGQLTTYTHAKPVDTVMHRFFSRVNRGFGDRGLREKQRS